MSLADVLTPTLSRLQARYEQSPLPRFLGWWLGELRALLPKRWRDRLAVQEAELWLSIDGDDLRVERVISGVPAEAVRLPLQPIDELPDRLDQLLGDRAGSLRRTLLLSSAQTLRRRLTLPPVSRDKLRTMLAFELDRQTPFRAEQVVFDSRVLPHAPDARQLPVELVLVLRETLDQQLQFLGPLATTLDAVDVRDADHRLGCNLLVPERRRRRDARGRWINAAMIAASIVLVVLAMGQVVENRRAAVIELQETIDRQRSAARGVAQLRAQLDEAIAAANFLAVQKAQRPSMLKLLAELSELLPDHTYLERFSTSGGSLSMFGLSDQAAGLIEQLQRSTMIRNPSLAGAINPDPRSKKDRFTITAELVPVDQVAVAEEPSR